MCQHASMCLCVSMLLFFENAHISSFEDAYDHRKLHIYSVLRVHLCIDVSACMYGTACHLASIRHDPPCMPADTCVYIARVERDCKQARERSYYTHSNTLQHTIAATYCNTSVE